MSDLRLPKLSKFEFTSPIKRIHDSQTLLAFQSSSAIYLLQKTLTKIVRLVENRDVPFGVLDIRDLYTDDQIKLYDQNTPSTSAIPIFTNNSDKQTQLNTIYQNKPVIKSIVDLLENFSTLIDQTPPHPGPRRYGNFACREWHDKLEESIDDILREHILQYYSLPNPDGFLLEIKWYILNAFGSRERLDYGSGHELNFLAFLTGLLLAEVLDQDIIDGYDYLVLFGKYYTLVRKLITTYTLEPAGSHGVWGLDDHFHIIYILGASQISTPSSSEPSEYHSAISPRSVNDKSSVYHYSTTNLYFNAVSFILKVKKGPFFEHSPILYDVSSIKSWDKILKGMIKMFQAEVLSKFPVVQHFYFGNVLLTWTNIKTGRLLPILSGDEEASKAQPNIFKKEEFSKVPQTSNVPSTAAPWAKKTANVGMSLQDKILKSSETSRRKTHMTSQGSPSTDRTQFSVATKAPWLKK